MLPKPIFLPSSNQPQRFAHNLVLNEATEITACLFLDASSPGNCARCAGSPAVVSEGCGKTWMGPWHLQVAWEQVEGGLWGSQALP